MIKRNFYIDRYNKRKTWQVNHMKGAKYLKQFIDGVQCGTGVRCTDSFIKSIGIYDFQKVD